MSDLIKVVSQKLNDRIDEIKRAYVNFVTENPAKVDQIESTVKAASYILEALSHNYETSIFITEFVSSACNLFTYANSFLYLKSKKLFLNEKSDELVEKIKQVLCVIEFSQAFMEISAAKVGGPGARWAVIVLICLIKAILRCILLFMFDSGIQSHSLTNLIKASTFISSTKKDENSETAKESEPEVIYIGSRTGHQMRTLDAASSSHHHWSSPHGGGAHNLKLPLPPTILTKQEKIGECLHAIRPLVHVLSSGVFGEKSFVPWLTALVMDSSSHVLLQRNTPSPTCTQAPFNNAEVIELRRRYANLLLYLLRSPIYDRYMGPKLLKSFAYLSKNVPLAKYVFDSLSKYLPEWQKVYFYTWTD